MYNTNRNTIDDARENWVEFLAAAGPFLVWTVTFLILILALIAFISSDVVVGWVTGAYLSGNTPWFGIFSSLATTGLTAGSIFAVVTAVRKKWSPWIIVGLVLLTGALTSADVYLDMLSVDIMRFGGFIDVRTQFTTETAMTAHLVFRALIGGISLVGEPIGMAAIVMFPALKQYILDSIQDGQSSFKNRGRIKKRPSTPHNTPYTPQPPAPLQPSYRIPRPNPQPAQGPGRPKPTYHTLGISAGRRDPEEEN